MKPLIASRRSAVAPFLAMDVMREAVSLEQKGAHIVHMEVGEPGAPAPRVVREAAKRALDLGRIGYTEALGLRSLRQRIATHYKEMYGVEVSAERIAVTTGSSGGFVLSFLACFDVGARVAISAPGYPAYRNVMDALGIEPVSIETHADTRFAVTAERIEQEHAKKPLQGVLLMSPANPSGTMMTPQALKAVCETCDRLGIAFISDEIYHGLTYAEPAETALKFSNQAIVVNSFSKYFCMTGWRVGWLVLPENLVRPVERLQQSLAISVPYLSQIAGEAAFDATEELELVKAGYAKNRSILLNEFPGLGLGDFHPADGAFYIYTDCTRFSDNSLEFAKNMLEQAGVAATPGVDFDPARGHHTIRFSFAGAEGDIVEAVKRLKNWLPR